MPLSDYLKGPEHRAKAIQLADELAQLRQRYGLLQELAKKYGAMDAQEVQRQIQEQQQVLLSVQDQVARARQEETGIRAHLADQRAQVLVVEEALLLESFALYLPKFKLNSSAEYKARLDTSRERQKAMIKGVEAATGNMNWEVNGKKSEGKKLVTDMIKLVVRSFNNESDYCVDNVKFDNVQLGEKRIRQSFEACNKLGRVMTVALSPAYLQLKLDELHLAHEFQLKKQEERESTRLE